MRTAWNVVSFVAVVNLLALLFFGGWLWQSGRLDRARALRIRAILAPTIEQEQARVAAEAAARAEAADRAAVEARQENPPLPSAAVVRRTSELDAQIELARRRMRDERDQLLADYARRVEEIDRREAAFEEEKARWQAVTAAGREDRADEQFRKAVAFYETAKPRLARDRLLVLYESGEADQVVAYLDAMNPRAARKILDEFKTDADNQLATELLEKLRTFGLDGEVAETTGNDDAPATLD